MILRKHFFLAPKSGDFSKSPDCNTFREPDGPTLRRDALHEGPSHHGAEVQCSKGGERPRHSAVARADEVNPLVQGPGHARL